MEIQKEAISILDLSVNPGFCVKDNIITAVNQAAAGLMLTPGIDVRTILSTGAEEYAGFQGECLYLTLNIPPAGIGATVVRMGDVDLFLLEPDSADSALQAMALASVQLRDPLTSALSDTETLLSMETDGAKDALERLNRALYKMHRMLCNMSDAARWQHSAFLETRNVSRVFDEIFEKACSVLDMSGSSLIYEGLEENIYSLADAAQLERAVLNVLSNAFKFSPKGSTIRASLTRRNRLLLLSILDDGSGINHNVQRTVFSRYLRQPAPEESRYGLGLGMVLIRSTAAAHGGTVLIDQPDGKGTRVTMTLPIRQKGDASLRTPIFRVDYAGERDHTLVELSDVLPPELYQK